jgi:hypothetical protein
LNAIRTAVLATALAAPLATLAAPRGAAPRGVAPAPATETRPRAPAAAPTPAHAPLVAPAEDEPGAEWRVGPALGFEFGMGDLEYSGPKVRIEATRAYRRVSPTTTLSLVGSLSVTHASGKEDVPVPIPAFPLPIIRQTSIEWDANVFELIPGARLTYATTPKVAFFADGGLGLAYTAGRVYLPPAAASLGDGAVLSDGVGGVLRLAGGVVITPSPALRIAVEAVGLNVRFGDGPGTGFSLGASLTHRL